jgi:magnesium transporter
MKPISFSSQKWISRLLPRIAEKSGSPGTVNYIGRDRTSPVTIHVFIYNESECIEKTVASVDELFPLPEIKKIWINVNGVHDTAIIESIGEKLNIHSLVLEDIVNTTHRPKMEEYDDYLFLVMKMSYIKTETKDLVNEQISLILKKNMVISFQEKDQDVLEGIRQRLRKSKGRIRKMGSDYLMYAIIDSIVDHYFTILEFVGDRIEQLEDDLIKKSNSFLQNHIYRLKQELIFMRKAIWPMRDVTNSLQHTEHKLISKSVEPFIRDVYDHTIQVIETVETFRDMASGMQDLYLSTVSNRMNEIMKVLTIFAAIFIPLSFLAGVYGMNFEFMPELKHAWGYFIWWGAVIVVAASMLIYFKKKKWL